ncbi:MAG TPA: cyclic nucleotide-binding domain-containing protein, partial [Spirochaetia bacterium]|nr:cyclic nucleotide-binding domain-containing protein [Spirochaetia bacterium]
MDARSSLPLTHSRLLSGLSEAQLALLVPIMKLEEFSPGQVIVRQSFPPERVYLLMEGHATVRRAAGSEEITLAELTEGDFFGEMGVIRGAEEHSASVIAASPVKTFSLSKDDFTRLLA